MPTIRAVLFDFGGVVAQEGFVGVMRREALAQGLDPQAVMLAAVEAMYGSGYLTNAATEEDFWSLFQAASGLKGDWAVMREAILSHCTPRPEMLALAGVLAAEGIVPAILSDHTDWLDELERRHGFAMHYEHVFNSYHTGSTKREQAAFLHALEVLDVTPEEAVFVDDARRNVALARELGLHAVLCEELPEFAREFRRVFSEAGPSGVLLVMEPLLQSFLGRP
ncbi:HAD family hydrolase [Megalodesulfovibrio paquesii]